jgi:hypothetical protein
MFISPLAIFNIEDIEEIIDKIFTSKNQFLPSIFY